MEYLEFCTIIDVLAHFYIDKERNKLRSRYRAVIIIQARSSIFYNDLLDYFEYNSTIRVIRKDKKKRITISNIYSVLELLDHVNGCCNYNITRISLLRKFINHRLSSNKKRYNLNDEIYYKTLRELKDN